MLSGGCHRPGTEFKNSFAESVEGKNSPRKSKNKHKLTALNESIGVALVELLVPLPVVDVTALAAATTSVAVGDSCCCCSDKVDAMANY